MGKLDNINVNIKSNVLINNNEKNDISEIQTSDLYIDGPMRIDDPKDNFELCVGSNCYKQKDFKNLLKKSAIPYQHFDKIGDAIPSVSNGNIVEPVPDRICLERRIKAETEKNEKCKKPRREWDNTDKKDCDICLKPWHLKILKGDDFVHLSDKTDKLSGWSGDTCKNELKPEGDCAYTQIRDYHSGLMHVHISGGSHDTDHGMGVANYVFNKFHKYSPKESDSDSESDFEKKSRFKMVSDNTSETGKFCKTV